ncbi:type I methionyl aminopeptidase [Micropruina sp.]|uniref:type I methionyl aminopeptidase n=1 Tax=Micropruina sp. TaxID=2737536 RepID=UPI0039E6C941
MAGGIEVKTPEQILVMRRAGLVVARTLAALRDAARAGLTTGDLDRMARVLLAEQGATSSFLNYGAGYGVQPFPAVTCISVNDEIVHGIPGERVLADGDLVSVDFGAIVDGWHGDSALSFVIGEPRADDRELSEVTRRSMWRGIAAARLGGRIGDISAAIEGFVRTQPRRYGIVREFTGHGIGSAMHQAPDVPNHGRRGRGPLLVQGMCLAIEPMLTLGGEATATLEDDWTVVTRDGSRACHWEHTVAITRRGLWVLTAEDGGEAELTALGARFGPLGD